MLLRSLREKIGNYFLSKEVKQLKRQPQVLNIAEANTIGIIFNCHNETTLTLVNKYVKMLREEIGVFNLKILAYFDEKEFPTYLDENKLIQSFGHQNLNWQLLPNGEKVEDFLKNDFDILIDLSVKDILPIKAITARAKAKMKVGKQIDSKTNLLDLMVNVSDSESVPDLIEQITHFLKMINKTRVKNG